MSRYQYINFFIRASKALENSQEGVLLLFIENHHTPYPHPKKIYHAKNRAHVQSGTYLKHDRVFFLLPLLILFHFFTEVTCLGVVAQGL